MVPNKCKNTSDKQKTGMTIEEAVDILDHQKEHWSHEIDDAVDTCIAFTRFTVYNGGRTNDHGSGNEIQE